MMVKRCLLVLWLIGCDSAAVPEPDELLTDMGGPTCELPMGVTEQPSWFQAGCFESNVTPAVVASEEEWDALFEEYPCIGPRDAIDFSETRALVFFELGRVGSLTTLSDGSLHVAMTTYAGPAPGSQGNPIALVPQGDEPVDYTVCQGSTGCTPDGNCPP